MKHQRILSLLLAGALTCALLWTPACAAPDPAVMKEVENGIVVTVRDRKPLETTIDVRLRDWSLLDDGETFVLGQPGGKGTIPVLKLPLGVSLMSVYGSGLCAYSDPDGDGVFTGRMMCYDWSGGGTEVEGVLPLTEQGPLSLNGDAAYFFDFVWAPGRNHLNEEIFGGYTLLTSDYLTELFGPNTLLAFSSYSYETGETTDVYFLLTGEACPQAASPYTLESVGISVTEDYGFLVSPWAQEYIAEASVKGLIPTEFFYVYLDNFTEKITRAQLACVAVNLYHSLGGASAPMPRDENGRLISPFTDVHQGPNSVGVDIEHGTIVAYYLGIVEGSGGEFRPDGLVTRQDAAVMLSRVYERLGVEIPSVTATSFADDGEIDGYARDAVAFMSQKGIISGVGGNRFDPKGYMGIEEALKIALEMYKAN